MLQSKQAKKEIMMKKQYSTRVKVPDYFDLKVSTGVRDTQHDAATLNLPRMVAPDYQWKTESPFLKCKKEVQIATFNVRTLRSISKTGELVAQASL